MNKIAVFSSVFLVFSSFLVLAQSYTDVTHDVNVNSQFGFGNLGGGLSLVDFDGDGWDDLTVATAKGDHIDFYKNIGGVFEKITPLVSDTSEVKSVLWLDIDNDGDKDLFITTHEDQNRLYENTGDLELMEITSEATLVQIKDPSFGATCADYNNDGYLDIYVANYYDGLYRNILYKNNGDKTFSNVTISSGVALEPNLSFQASFVDIDQDLLPDLYLAIDKPEFENKLFRNNGDGTFADISEVSGANVSIYAMNSSSGDIDNDGDLDIYVTNTAEGNVFLRNNGNGTFTDITERTGLEFNRIGWATSFFDEDNDGDLDMYVSAMSSSEPNALYINNGDTTFSEPFRHSGGLNGTDMGSSLCNVVGDFDHDGLMDIFVSNENHEPIVIYKNQNQQHNDWIKLRLKGIISNRDGIGAWIHVYMDDDRVLRRYTDSGKGFLGQYSEYSHIGLGHNATIDSIEVLWPSGIKDIYYDVEPNQAFWVEEGQSPVNPQPCPLIKAVSDGQGHSVDVLLRSSAEIVNGSSVMYNAGSSVILEEGMTVAIGNQLTIEIKKCREE